MTNGEYLAFIEDGGYSKHEYWHAEGLEWVKNNNINAPLYWHWIDGRWQYYSASGIQPVNETIQLRMSAIMKHQLLPYGWVCGYLLSLSGRRQIDNSCGATDGNGHPVLILPIQVI